jgi:RND superfamily putative drug exporter
LRHHRSLEEWDWDRSHDPREAMVGGLAHSGRVIFAAGAVMVAVFLNVRAVRAVAAEADGDDLRHAVLLDALLVG